MRLSKQNAIKHWRSLASDMPLEPVAIPYKQSGSTYGADGIRIEGSQEFIDAVLGRLSGLLDYENHETRLGLNYQQVEPREGKANNYAGQWVCYVKIHERGHEGKIMSRVFGHA